MDFFQYRGASLFGEDIDLRQLADEFGTPCYVYSRATLERHWRAFDHAFGSQPHLICYAVKANSNIAVLDVLARLGSGFDIVSGGELQRVLRAGGEPAKVIFSGVGKQRDEIVQALSAGIGCFNVESADELELLQSTARDLNRIASVSIRVNPDVDPDTHPYIATGLRESKFGVLIDVAAELYQRIDTMSHLEVHGVDCHIGSQLTSLGPYIDAVTRVLTLVDELAALGIKISSFNVGGGLGIRYHKERPPEPKELIDALLAQVQGRDFTMNVEPGRAIAGNAGILLTRVQFLKHSEARNFAIVDAAMNDLIRPALYDGWHEIVPVQIDNRASAVAKTYDVVGPVCESADFLGKQRSLKVAIGDLLAVRSAGAYSFAMSSNYNSRPRACEIMVDGDRAHVVRRRESVSALFASESLLPV
jgi:diaminopimelate decarboxylase